MKFYNYSDKNLFIISNLCNNFNQLFKLLERSNPLKKIRPRNIQSMYANSVILVIGNCEIGLRNEQYYLNLFTQFHDYLCKNNIVILFVRGSSDNPQYFSEEKINFSNIKTIPDYSVVKTRDYTTLCVGGGISLDRIWRKEQESLINRYKSNEKKQLYWENEACVYNQELIDEILKNNIQIDSMISYLSPTFATVPNHFNQIKWFKCDKNLQEDISNNQKVLSKIHETLNNHGIELKFWGYAYCHEYRTTIETVYDKSLLSLSLTDNYQLTSPYQIMEQLKPRDKKIVTSKMLNNDMFFALASSSPLRSFDVIDANGNHLNEREMTDNEGDMIDNVEDNDIEWRVLYE